ncbi:alpha/beta hydrolase family protein [Longispora urticae]
MDRRAVLLSGFALAGAGVTGAGLAPSTASAAPGGPPGAAPPAPPGDPDRPGDPAEPGGPTPPREWLPAPTGPRPVGTLSTRLVDHSRRDPYAPGQRWRELMVQAWYPAAPAPGPRAAYLAPKAVAHLEAGLGVPAGSLAQLRPYARTGAPPARTGCPVVLFSHGWGGGRTNATTLAEDLASHGYLVVAVDHTYDADAVEFPGGRLETSRLPAEPTAADDTLNIGVRVADLRFVADWCARWPVADVTRLGVLGHSMGGPAAADWMLRDRRVRCGVNLDGAFFGTRAPEIGLDRPFLLATADWDHDTWPVFRARHRGWGRHLVLAGSGHYSQVDPPWFVEPAGLADLWPADLFAVLFGTIAPDRSSRVARTYLRAYFDLWLRGRATELFDGPAAGFPEVEVRWRAGRPHPALRSRVAPGRRALPGATRTT